MHLHLFLVFLSGVVAFFWVFYGLRVGYGALQLPWVKNFPSADDSRCPRVSLIFAARDEEEKLPAALSTLAAIDYPHLEIVAVNDRSQDASGRILDEFARRHERFRVVHITSLPAGWLGKPHALQQGYEKAGGELILFTDADVRFAPDVVRRSVTLMREKSLDHLTLFCDVDMEGFWDKVLIPFFGLAFYLATDPYRACNPHSRTYVGVGAFQMLKRTAYEACGTHRRLALEVLDDMKLAKMVKEGGFQVGAAVAQDALAVRWHAGLGNLIRGVTKNFFAGAGYSPAMVIFSLSALLLTNVTPFVGLIFGHGSIRALSAVAVMIAVGFHAGVNKVMRVSPLYALTHPLGAILFGYMLLRSTVVTLWHGGVIWRGTFYPLEDLKKGVV
jgi:hypothetical protein